MIISVSVSYRSAPVTLLERVAIPTDELVHRLRVLAAHDAVDGCFVLSTCHRVEVYLHSSQPDRAVEAARNLVITPRGVSAQDIEGYSERPLPASLHPSRRRSGDR